MSNKQNDIWGENKREMGDILTCPFCKREISAVGIICPCEVAPKYDADYEEWKNK